MAKDIERKDLEGERFKFENSPYKINLDNQKVKEPTDKSPTDIAIDRSKFRLQLASYFRKIGREAKDVGRFAYRNRFLLYKALKIGGPFVGIPPVLLSVLPSTTTQTAITMFEFIPDYVEYIVVGLVGLYALYKLFIVNVKAKASKEFLKLYYKFKKAGSAGGSKLTKNEIFRLLEKGAEIVIGAITEKERQKVEDEAEKEVNLENKARDKARDNANKKSQKNKK